MEQSSNGNGDCSFVDLGEDEIKGAGGGIR